MKGISLSGLRELSAWQKEDRSFVTTLDLHLQAQYIEIIRKYFPDHNILHEEGKPENMGFASEYTWVIDPIDGTNNMVQGKKEYSSCVGLMQGNRFIAALVYFPEFHESYKAMETGDVFKNDERYILPVVPKDNKEIILCSKSYGHLKDIFISAGYHVTCYYCATYSLLKILNGEAVVYHTKNTKLYDVGPMSYILSKAGIGVYDRSPAPMLFRPSLELIPFFIASAQEEWVNKFILKIGNEYQ